MFRNYLNNLKIYYSVWVVKHDFTSKNSLIKASPQRQCFVNITNYLKAPEPWYEIDNVFKYIITQIISDDKNIERAIREV